MNKIKCAIFGAGFWSQFQIPAWQELDGVEIVAIYNRTVAKAELMAEKFHIPRVYGDAEELFKNEELDLADIITEIPAHYPLVALAARYRVPVICQKPMAPDYETCCEMVRLCDEANIPFMIHDNFRWMTTWRGVKGLLESGVIGEPYKARFQFWHGTKEQTDNQPFLKTLKQWVMTDIGSHAFDLARFLFGEPQSLYCQTHVSGITPDAAGEDVASAMLRIGRLICEVEFGYVYDPALFVEGTRGTLELWSDYSVRVSTEAGQTVQSFPPPYYPWIFPDYGPSHPATKDTNAHLLECLLTGRRAETSGAEYLKTMRLVYTAYESAQKNQVIFLD